MNDSPKADTQLPEELKRARRELTTSSTLRSLPRQVILPPQEEAKDKALNLGANEFITKPFSPIQVINGIRRIPRQTYL